MKKPIIDLEARFHLAEKTRQQFALWILRWQRQARQVQIQRDRREQALMFKKYELVGGHRDGEVVVCYGLGLCPEYSYAGVYHLKDDGRLHYRARELPPLDLE